MSTPLVSILITCFNLGEYLHDAVASVLSQSFTDFEILIVDDGSTDPETRRMLDGYQRPGTSIFRTRNQGVAAARNYLIARATGKYLCALDADDKLHSEYLAKTTAVLERDPAVAFVSTHLQMFGDEDRQWPDEANCNLATLLSEDTVITPALVRREAVQDIGGYDQSMPHQGDEDWDLWISLVEAGYVGCILDEVLFFYRRRRGSMCDLCTTGQAHLDLVDYIVRKHAASYRAHLLPVPSRKERRIAMLRRANLILEMELEEELTPLLELRREELERLRTRLQAVRLQRQRDQPSGGPLDVERDRLVAECARMRQEIAALRASASWRLTAPLRGAYDALAFWSRR